MSQPPGHYPDPSRGQSGQPGQPSQPGHPGQPAQPGQGGGQPWNQPPSQQSGQSGHGAAGPQPGHAPGAGQWGGSPGPGGPGVYQGGPGGYQSGPQGFQGGPGGPDGSHGPKKSRAKLFVILGLVGVLAIGGIIAAVLLLGDGGGDGASGDDPVETVDNFIEAAEDDDCEAIEKLLTENLQKQDVCEGKASDESMTGGLEFGDAEEESEDGDRATVTVPVSGDVEGGSLPEGSNFEFQLVKEDGKWLIDGLGPNHGSSEPELPTDIPTDVPTDIPTGIPSDIPTEYLTE